MNMRQVTEKFIMLKCREGKVGLGAKRRNVRLCLSRDEAREPPTLKPRERHNKQPPTAPMAKIRTPFAGFVYVNHFSVCVCFCTYVDPFGTCLPDSSLAGPIDNMQGTSTAVGLSVLHVTQNEDQRKTEGDDLSATISFQMAEA